MPVDIMIASIVGVIIVIWLIKRSRAEPRVEFRQDTMRYIDVNSTRKANNHTSQTHVPIASQEENDLSAVEPTPNLMAQRYEPPSVGVTPKPVFADEGRGEPESETTETMEESEDVFASPELLLGDK